MPERPGDTVHIVVCWTDEYEQAYTYEAEPGEAEDSWGRYEFDVPRDLWERAESTRRAAREAAAARHRGDHLRRVRGPPAGVRRVP